MGWQRSDVEAIDADLSYSRGAVAGFPDIRHDPPE